MKLIGKSGVDPDFLAQLDKTKNIIFPLTQSIH